MPDDYFSELKCFNKKVSFQDKIESLLPKETEEQEEEKYPEIIGKPFYNPFEILCFYKSKKKFVNISYNKDIKEKTNIDNFNITSAYCNGCNHLYISGGENSLNNFLDINLKKNIINTTIIDMPSKKFHSMIYIKNGIVFIVGGMDLNTFYYDIKEKRMKKWGKLNKIRIEPALQVINNNLYCFDCTNLKESNNEYSFELTELYSNNEPQWIFIKPKINFDIMFNQQLFGVAKDKNNNIVFLGGRFHDEDINIEYKKIMNFMLDINKNEIILSEIQYKKFNLKERGFFPFNKTYDCILTDFQRSSPQICFFNKKKFKLELINFTSDKNFEESSKNSKNGNKNNILPSFSFGKNLKENNNIKTSLGLRNPNQNPKYNTYIENNNNYGYLSKETSQFEKLNNNYFLNNNKVSNTYNITAKTPERNIYRIKKLNYPNKNIYESERSNSYDSRKFYYPKNGLKNNKNIYNYYSKK